MNWPGSTALLLLAMAGCTPWYRENEVRQIRALDHGKMVERLTECDKQAKSGAKDGGPACYQDVARTSPRNPVALLALARAFIAQKRLPEGRAVADFALHSVRDDDLPDAEDPEGKRAALKGLADLVVESYVSEGLYSAALRRAGKVPLALEAAGGKGPVFAKLLEAKEKAERGDTQAALDAYADWLADYGTPDEYHVRAWSDAILEKTKPLTEHVLEDGDREAKAGNWIGARRLLRRLPVFAE